MATSLLLDMSGHTEQGIEEILMSALEHAEEALSAVTRTAIEQIRGGLEASNHVEAAERDMRSALRQLVLAERELRAKPAAKAAPAPPAPTQTQ